MDEAIKRIQAYLPSIIVTGLSLYFALIFVLSGSKTLLALYEGSTDYVATALAQAIGYTFAPGLAKVTVVAGMIGAFKLAIGAFFILGVAERSARDGTKEYGALDFALHGAVALMMFQAIPAWMGGDDAAVRAITAHGMLICVIVGTSMFEREQAARNAPVDEYETTPEYRSFR
jgi:hypothetical protein